MSEEEKKVAELEQSLQRERERAQRFDAELRDKEKKLESYSKYGDVDKIHAMTIELEKLKTTSAGTTPEDLEKLVNERFEADRAAAAKRIAELEEKVNMTTSQLHEIEVVGTAWEKIGKDFTPDASKLLKGILREKLIKGEDGNVRVRGKDGKPELVDGTRFKTIEEFGAELLTEYPSLKADKSIPGTMKPGTTTASNGDSSKIERDFSELKTLPRAEVRKYAEERAKERFNLN